MHKPKVPPVTFAKKVATKKPLSALLVSIHAKIVGILLADSGVVPKRLWNMIGPPKL